MIILNNMFSDSQELVQVDFEDRVAKQLSDHRNSHQVNNESIAIKVSSLCVIEQHFLNDELIKMNEDITTCFNGLRDDNWMLREINSDFIYKVLDANEIQIPIGDYENYYSLESDEIDFEFGMSCINLSIGDCTSIGGSFNYNKSEVNENNIVKGVLIQQESVQLYFMSEETKKNANSILDDRLISIKEVFIKYNLDINAFNSITSNLYL